MYVETARSSNAAASASGRTKYPVRTPGATVFENDDVYVTSVAASSSCRLGGASPRTARGRTGRPRAPRARARGRSRRAGRAARTTASSRSGSGRSGSCRGTTARRGGCAARLERIGIEPLLVHRERDDLGAIAREDLQRPVVARRLDEHAPGPARELLSRVEHEPLKTADREHDALGRDAVPLRDPLPERCVAAARAVREDLRAVPLSQPRARSPRARRRGSSSGAGAPRAKEIGGSDMRSSLREVGVVVGVRRHAATEEPYTVDPGRELVPAPGGMRIASPGPTSPRVPIDLELSAALDDQIDLLAACVVVPPRRSAASSDASARLWPSVWKYSRIVEPSFVTNGAASRSRFRSSTAALRAGDLGDELGGLGRRRADAHPTRLERFLLRLRRARGARDDRAGMPHRLAGRRGEAGDVPRRRASTSRPR